MQGERRPQSCSPCRRVQREGHSLPRGDGGWEPLSEGPGRVIPAVGFKGERTLPPLVGVVGGEATCLNRVKYSIPTEWMRWLRQYFALLSYGKFKKFALAQAMEPPETTDLRRILVLFLNLAVSQSDTIAHTYISTEKTVKNVVDCGCDCSVRDTASGVHILYHLHELRCDWNLWELHRGRTIYHRRDITLYEI